VYVQGLHRDGASLARYVQFDNTTDDAAVAVRLDSGGAHLQFTVTDAAVSQANIDLGAAAMLARNQISASWRTNDVAASFDGVSTITDTIATIPSVTTLRLGADSTGSGFLNGFLYRLVVVPRHVEVDDGNLRSWRYNFCA